MATRFYLQNAAPGASPSTNRGAWDDVASKVFKGLSRTKSGTIASLGVPESSTTGDYDVMILKLVSEPVPAQSITGTVQVCIGALESSTQQNAHWHLHVYVTQGDTDSLVGTLLTDYTEPAGTNEWPTTAQGHQLNAAQNLSSVTAGANDRIVVELGYVSRNTSGTTRTGTLWYGGTGSDLTASGDETTLTGWVEFSQSLFFTTKTLSASSGNSVTMARASSFVKALSSSSANAVSMAMVAARVASMSASSTVSSAMDKVASMLVSMSASSTASGTMSETSSRLLSFSASSVISAALSESRLFMSSLSAALVGAASLTALPFRSVALSVTATVTASLSRALSALSSLSSAAVVAVNVISRLDAVRSLSAASSSATSVGLTSLRSAALSASALVSGSIERVSALTVSLYASASAVVAVAVSFWVSVVMSASVSFLADVFMVVGGVVHESRDVVVRCAIRVTKRMLRIFTGRRR